MCHLQFIIYWLSYVPYDCNLLVCGALYSGVNTRTFQRNLLPVSSQMLSNKFLYFVSLLFALQTFHFQSTCSHTLISVTVHPHYLIFLWFSDLMEIHYIGRYSDSLWAGLSGGRISEKARFSTPVQTDSGAHSLLSDELPVKRSGCGVDHPPTASADFKERVELYLYSSSGPSWPVLG
jgi:hypothetical protein